ncbi:hypothetical protein HMPREF0971_02075 [Segatella oris F0302]|uniref:Uncharacterized protein n=1 Tax=Segatella oris F0302 TaxID=649760 RepID=D1QSW3_9BACT|nr:hypothetical protein HMPREF0971_02075 [Segatella oris F0302]
MSSASSYRAICVRLRGILHQVTTQSASSYNTFHYHIDNYRLKIIKEEN